MNARRTMQAVLAAAVAVGPVTAAAAEAQGWSMFGAQTSGDGANVVAVDAGFPSIALTFFHGVTSIEDVGVRLAFNYAFEGIPTAIYPGLRGEAIARLKLLDSGHLSLGVKGGVGMFGYFAPIATVLGVTIPLGVAVGIPVGSQIAIATGIDVPLFITFGPTGGLTAPILIDAALEYALSARWQASFHARMGPALNPTGPLVPNGSAQIGFEIGIGTAFKL
ncbi:MAG TPA: hypothetical protein VND93_16215 [Myxococcales bacterium]|nr:hypothetical protein [Myxococcales bacterium]